MGVQTDDQVSWQSAFWGLVPLLLSVMTQPCGRVCHFSSRLRTYVRCSPIICAADALATLIEMTALTRRGANPRDAAYAILKARYHDEDTGSGSGEGLQSVEKLGFIRALLFLLGTLPQVVKVMAMRGIPWTQVWAALYLGSFVITEAVLLLARDPGPANYRIGNDYPVNIARAPTVRVDPQAASPLILGILSTLVHICLELWAYRQILGENLLGLDGAGPHIRNRFVLVVYNAASGLFTVAMGCIVALLIWIFVGFLGYRISLENCGIIMILFFGATLLRFFSQLRSLPEPVDLDMHRITLGVAGEVLVLFSVLYLVFLIMSLFSAYALFRRHVLFLADLGEQPFALAPKKAVGRSIGACMLFVSTFVLAILWYGIRYEPAGTLKPEWTNILG